MCWHYDHCKGRSVKGINLLNALYHCKGHAIPVAFELVTKPYQYCDLKTRQIKRRSEKTKNELMREMIGACIRNTLKFRFVLMDSWFFSQENFAYITSSGKHFIAALKNNRLVALSEDDRRNKRFVAVDKLEFPEHGAVQGWMNGYAKEVRLVRQVFTNKDASTGTPASGVQRHHVRLRRCSLELQETMASGSASQEPEIKRRSGQVTHTDSARTKLPRLHVDLRGLQARILVLRQRSSALVTIDNRTASPTFW